ncbi:MAG: AsmA family protein, partial [Alphaproteobacteria bacterium]|nr:AsmA family protein [Alphaproteobacteria bacterium]
MRKILIALVTMLASAVGALAAAPHFIDPEASRDFVISGLRRITGREVAIDGPLSLQLLPVPSVTARAVRLVNPPGTADPDLMRIGGLELRIAVMPLLSGRLVFRSVTMADPELDLERLADGRLNLEAPPPQAQGSAEGPPQASSAAAAPRRFAIERVDITNGRLLYRADGALRRIDRLDLSARLGEAGGPVRAAGTVQAGDARLGFTLESGLAGQRVPLDLKLDLLGTGTQAEIAGDAELAADGAHSFAGTLKLSGGDLAAVLRQVGQPAPAVLRHSFTLTGKIEGTATAIRLDPLALSLDEARGTGTLRLIPGGQPRVALALAFGQIDLDRLMAAAPPLLAVSRATPAKPDDAAAFTLPTSLQGSLDLAVDGAVWHGGVLHDLRLAATVDDGTATIARGSALLPGGSDVTLSGKLATTAAGPRLVGAIEAGSDNLRQLLDWLGMPVQRIPADRLRKAALTSRFVASPETLTIDALDLTLDSTRLTGAATIALRQRLGFGARLTADQLNLDAYLPGFAGATAAPGTGGALLGGVD